VALSGWASVKLITLAVILSLGPSQLFGQALKVDLQPVGSDTVGTLTFERFDASPNFNFHVFPYRGGWGVTSATFPGEVAFFRQDFSWSRKEGGQGQGPGEFTGMVRGVEIEGGLVVLDSRGRRATWLDSTFQFVESRPVPGHIFSAQSDGEGGVLVGGQFMVGLTVFTVLRMGSEVGSDFRLGAPSSSARPQEDFPVLLPVVGDELWAVKYSGGMIDVLDPGSLEVRDRLRIPLDGYDVPVPDRFNIQREPPTPQITSGSATPDGLGVFFASVADSGWSPGGRLVDQVYDTEVILVDLPTRTIVGTQRFPGICTTMGGLLAGCLTDLGDIRVLRLHLESQENGSLVRKDP